MRRCLLILFLSWNIIPVHANDGAVVSFKAVSQLRTSELPKPLAKSRASSVLLVYEISYSLRERPQFEKLYRDLVKDDQITDFKAFQEKLKPYLTIEAFRLLFLNETLIDSIWEADSKYRLRLKGYPLGEEVKIIQYDSTLKTEDDFILDYRQKLAREGKPDASFAHFVLLPVLYNYYDRNNYVVNKVWLLNIGIDDNGPVRYRNCGSDSRAYDSFFRASYGKYIRNTGPSLVEGIVLIDSMATRERILASLKSIADRAKTNDYFIFTFSGESSLFAADGLHNSTYFSPFNCIRMDGRSTVDTAKALASMISLKELQEHIQMIPCNRQLFISEAGPSEKFKTELIREMMQHSPDVAAMLNINRVIIVPNGWGLDNLNCNKQNTGKAPITYFITSLEGYNIFDLFNAKRSGAVATALKAKAYSCDFIENEYFDVFFEKKFLQDFREIAGDGAKTRGGKFSTTADLPKGVFSGKRYAMVVGTDNYRPGAGWDKLNNPVYDASEIAALLENYYDFEVKLLTNASMDSIYAAVRNYYQQLGSDDQLVIYIAGHGDFDNGLLDDGFIVCSDSRSVEEDPLRNSYIQHTKLKKMINKIPARQILVMLDICHGGTFDAEVLGKTRENPVSNISNRNVIELLKEKSQYKTRKVLSSVGTEPAFDGKAGRHSPFAAYLLKILQAGGGDQPILTLSDIYAILQKASLNETETLKISPHIANFGDFDPFSEFIFIPVKKMSDGQGQ